MSRGPGHVNPVVPVRSPKSTEFGGRAYDLLGPSWKTQGTFRMSEGFCWTGRFGC